MSSITPAGKFSVMEPSVFRGAKKVGCDFPGAHVHHSYGVQYQCRRALIVVIAFVLAALL